MIIIPAIDIIDGKCVRLTQGDYAQKTIYNQHPLEVAKMFEDAGLQRLHLLWVEHCELRGAECFDLRCAHRSQLRIGQHAYLLVG